MKSVLEDYDDFRGFLDELLVYDLPLEIIESKNDTNSIRMLLNSVIGLGELYAVYKLLHMIQPEQRRPIFENENSDEVFFEVVGVMLTNVKEEIIETMKNQVRTNPNQSFGIYKSKIKGSSETKKETIH